MKLVESKSTEPSPFAPSAGSLSVPYPAIERHALIGDRRTAALVASDGTIDWLCLPDFDGVSVFGGLLDALSGGFWRLGPALRLQGRQTYIEDTMLLETRWEVGTGELVLSDAMLWPETARPPEQAEVRTVVRRLRCSRGEVQADFDLLAGYNFQPSSASFVEYASGYNLALSQEMALRVWASFALKFEGARLRGRILLREGQEVWTVLDVGATGRGWSVDEARSAWENTERYWRTWCRELDASAVERVQLRRTALMVHVLTYANGGSVVAAPTTSLPERIGGSWNADYRLSWVRDTSLALAILSRLGDWRETEKYLQWLIERQSRFGLPLQVLYDIRGGRRPKQQQLSEVAGYRGSRPVRLGNHAYKQRQLGSLGFLADCTWTYLQEGGRWHEDYWKLIRRSAQYVAKHWSEPDNGIWEVSEPRHFVHSKVLCWVMLDRAIKIAHKVNAAFDTSAWESQRARIHEEVMQKGWSERLGAFRQHYEGDNLDAAGLLVSIMEFLPGDDPRVLGTIDTIAQSLSIDGLVYRFDPLQTPGVDPQPLGQMEGAFLPCTFWLATAYAKAGRLEQAQSILARVEQLAGGPALFAEAVDPRTGSFLGNTPLLFSHVEYVRAKLEIAAAQNKGEQLPQAA